MATEVPNEQNRKIEKQGAQPEEAGEEDGQGETCCADDRAEPQQAEFGRNAHQQAGSANRQAFDPGAGPRGGRRTRDAPISEAVSFALRHDGHVVPRGRAETRQQIALATPRIMVRSAATLRVSNFMVRSVAGATRLEPGPQTPSLPPAVRPERSGYAETVF